MALIPAGFPAYEYRPYPKFLQLPDGSEVVADNAAHHAELLAPFADEGDDTDQEAERQALLERCKERGIKVHPKTGITKLREALA